MSQCQACGANFNLTQNDYEFYAQIGPMINGQKFAVPAPTQCFQCRTQRKLAFRNERHLYRRKCGLSGKEIFSIYSPDKSTVVYDNPLWYGDAWDPYAYAREYDPSRGFFEQFRDLLEVVPRPARIVFGPSENSDYCNHHLSYKDSYLCFWGDYNDRSVTCYGCGKVNSCIDCKGCINCGFCAAAINSSFCNNCAYIEECERVSDSRYLFNCRDCSHCFQCVNLRHKKYHIKNKAYPSREAYENALMGFDPRSRKDHTRCFAEFNQFVRTFPKRAIHNSGTEGCRGNHLSNAKDCIDCHWLVFEENEACHYTIASGTKIYKLYDCYGSGYNLSHCYESFGLASGVQDCAFCYYVEDGSTESFYSIDCRQVSRVFGCVGLKRASNCILNKQYSKEQYEATLKVILADMSARGEWGEFLPLQFSPFGYNESAAQDHYPLTRAEAERIGARWSNYENPLPSTERVFQVSEVPDQTDEAQVFITGSPIRCQESDRPFVISKLEWQLRKEINIPVVLLHPDVRIGALAQRMGPFRLWEAQCSQCGCDCDSGYDPKIENHLLCEECYHKEIVG